MSKTWIKIFAAFFYLGYFPVAPGTLASLLGMGLSLLLGKSPAWYVGVALVVLLLGFGTAGKMEKIAGEKDPSCVVIDEVAGSLVAFFLLPQTAPVLVTTFFLFRAFDMFKIYPINRCEAFPGSVGIMTDDLVAGFYTNITMQMAIRLAGLPADWI